MHIGVTHSDSHPIRLDRLRDALSDRGDYTVVPVTASDGGVDVPLADEAIATLEGSDALFVCAGRITADILDILPSVQAIQTFGSGFDHVDMAAATSRGVPVSHNPDAPARAVVERTFGLLFSLLGDMPAQFERCAAGKWNAARTWFTELGSITLSVVGLGTIGFPVAETAAEAFGADVVGCDPYVTGERSAPGWPRYDRETVEAAGVELVDLPTCCDRSDAVTIHVPLTEETRGLLDRSALRRLRDGYLVNTARGGVIDEAALSALTLDGQFAGLALDTFDPEPPPADYPLRGAPDVLITPHTAGTSHQTLDRAVDFGATKLDGLLRNDPPDTVLNPAVLGAGAL